MSSAEPPARAPVISANGIDIYYEVHGVQHAGGPRLPLVLTHGFAGPVEHWRPEVLPLAQDRTLILYDVRGHGRTSVPGDPDAYSIPTFAADLAALLDKLLATLEVQRLHVGGLSMGGMITARFAVDNPSHCESVLLCDTTCGNGADEGPAGDWEREIKEGVGRLSHMVERLGLRESLLREWEWKKHNDPHLDESPYSLEDDLRRIEHMTVPGYLGGARAIRDRPDLTSRLGDLTVPVLVMIGEWDGFLPCALRDHQLLPNSRLVIRERCAHGSRWRNETFVQQIREFLADVEGGRAIAGERRV
jgi:3-oxoadipate enol-lactonase